MKKNVFLVLIGFLLALIGCVGNAPDMIVNIDKNVHQDINGFQNLIDLNDTPDSYSGFANQCVIVTADENGVTFIACAAGSTDSTLDSNTVASDSYLGTPHDWNADQNFSLVNVFDLNIGQNIITMGGLDFNVFDLNLSVINVCVGDVNSFLNNSGECIKVTDLQVGGSFIDTTIDVNVTALNSFLGKSYVWLADQNFKQINVVDINISSGRILHNGLDFNLFDLNSNTNAETECVGNQVYLGDGNCLIYIPSETFFANTINTVNGTDFNNNVIQSIFFFDNNSYSVQEDAGANPLQVDINFTDVNSFDSIITREMYTGGAGHEVLIEVFDFISGVWEEHFEITDQGSFVTENIFIFDSNEHVSVDGNVNIRFRHEQVGNINHQLLIDFIWLQQGTTTSVTTEHDALSGRDSNSNHPWALDKLTAELIYWSQIDLNLLIGANIIKLCPTCSPTFYRTDLTSLNVSGGNVNIQGGTIAITSGFISDLEPNNDNQRDLGAVPKRWRDLFLGRNAVIGADANIGADINAGGNIYAGKCFLFADGTSQCTADLNYNSSDHNVQFDDRYNLTSDSNDVGRLIWSAINFIGATINQVTSLSLFDLNVGSGVLSVNNLDFNVFDLNYSVQSQCSGDANSTLNSVGDCVSLQGFDVDDDIYSHGIMGDANYWKIDINAGGKSVINVQDFNGTQIFIQTGDMNFKVYDTNVIIETANGRITINPEDSNSLCIGSDPNAMGCMWTTPDGNIAFGTR